MNAAELIYYECMNNEEYFKAACISETSSLGRDKVEAAANMARKKYISEKKFLLAQYVTQRFNLDEK
ncbi:MAG: hypothetical protein QXP52_01635 [Candidatus Aenigmatarchaeota archaeon]